MGLSALSETVRSLRDSWAECEESTLVNRRQATLLKGIDEMCGAYCLNSRSEENFIRNTSIFGAWNTAYSMEYVEYGWNTAEYRPLGGHLEYVENVFRQ